VPRKSLHIGGELDLDPALLFAATGDEIAPFFPNAALVSTGRTALKIIARLLKQSNRPPRVLLPSYLCASIVQPFENEQVSLSFYPVEEDLATDPQVLLRAIRQTRPGACLFINYFGFPPSAAVAAALASCRKDSWVIEDCSQGFWTEGPESAVGHVGDFVLASLRKFLPVPDGALLVNRSGEHLPALTPASGEFQRYRVLGKTLRYEFLQRPAELPEIEAAYMKLFAAAESLLDTEIPWNAASVLSRRVLQTVSLAEVMTRRRKNYSVLADAFAEDSRLRDIARPVFPDLAAGILPLAFPVRVTGQRRDELRRELAGRGIFCSLLWPLPSQVSTETFPGSHRLSRDILCLPVDQRYDAEDMHDMLRALLETARN
jgi:dTDP-4-amino-4,6-dideoxygalactose transaminase